MTALAVEPQNPAASTRLGEIISDQEQKCTHLNSELNF